MAVDLARSSALLGLDSRLRQIPASAQSRGLFFNMLRDDMAKRGLGDVPELKALLTTSRRSYGFYPVRELIEAYAIAGALVNADPIEGMRALFWGAVGYSAGTWYGRAFSRYIRPDPAAALRWLERSREYVANYGSWRLEVRSPEHAIMHMFDEFFWIEGAQRGGCEGLLTACGVEGEVLADLDAPFRGRLDIRWSR